jgi:hypothetical protein
MQQPQQGYGPPQQQWQGPPPKRGIGARTIILIIFGCLFSGCVGLCAIGARNTQKTAETNANDPASPAKKSAAAEAEPAAPKSYTKVTAAKLMADYDGNEIRGDNAWKDKDVKVTGIVRSIDKGPFGGLYVVLGSDEQMNFHSVRVNLKQSEQGRAANLNKGDSATFKGRIQGYVVGSVSVSDAELE